MTTTDPPRRGPDPARAGGRWARAWTVLLITLAIGLAADLVSKRLAFERIADQPVALDRDIALALIRDGRSLQAMIPPHEPVIVVPHALEFKLVLNSGAIFGIGPGKRWFFVIVTLGAIGVALWLFLRWTRPGDWAAHVGLGLVMAGGLGNLYDRLLFGCVRDFIHPLPGAQLPFGITWPGGGTELWPYVSNVADAELIVAIVLLLIVLWRADDEPSPTPDTPADAPAEAAVGPDPDQVG